MMENPPRRWALLLLLSILCAATGMQAQAQGRLFARPGFELTSRDIEIVRAEAAALYEKEDVALGDRASWQNGESGNRGTIEIVKIFEYEGMPCRRIQHDIRIAKVADDFRFIVDRCRIESGEWKIL